MEKNSQGCEGNYQKANGRLTEFEHAWKYFEFHAKQRTDLFRFYTVFFSIFGGGVGFLLMRFYYSARLHEYATIALTLIFIVITITFWALDRQSDHALQLAEEVLIAFEENHFGKNDKSTLKTFGIFSIKKDREKYYCGLRYKTCFNIMFGCGVFLAGLLIFFSLYSLCSHNRNFFSVPPTEIKLQL